MIQLNVKQKRAIRSALAVILVAPPIAMMALDYPNEMMRSWPLEWRVTFVVCAGLSFVVGWEPVKASWTGEDHELYVDEPEVDDDW